MPGVVVIYKNSLEGNFPVARLVMDEAGHTEFYPCDDPEAFEKVVGRFSGRWPSRVTLQEVSPDDGEDFLAAVMAELGHSTYLTAIREGPAPEEAVAPGTDGAVASGPGQLAGSAQTQVEPVLAPAPREAAPVAETAPETPPLSQGAETEVKPRFSFSSLFGRKRGGS